MKYSRIRIWEWVVWAGLLVLFIFVAISLFGRSMTAPGILAVVLAAADCAAFVYRIAHPESYERLTNAVSGAMTAEMLDGIAAMEHGKICELSLDGDDLIISDTRRKRYRISLSNLIDAEALGRKETITWRQSQRSEEDVYFGNPNPSWKDRAAEWLRHLLDRYFVVPYRDRASGEVRALVFRFRGDLKGREFQKVLQRRAALGTAVEL